ncbi:subtilisin-like serine protease pr1a [Venturia nashicola]|uniref:Subtilisin-like serine protease pr1a n=1 Tax=Venturia nashicola TaxID=86259 RepID=A0A4Z1PM23_9PEZI|nr:subtilisin-like serine protease pr1a [Venturia nashicola]TLD36238.1 subtilisin-like serine protease pr1a [Venturia nashicola]
MLSILSALSLVSLALGAPTATPTGKWLVVLKPNSNASPVSVLQSYGDISKTVSEDHVYDIGSFKGFAAHMTTEQLNAMKVDPRVAYMEQDGVVKTQILEVRKTDVTEVDAPWGLGRVSHRSKGSSDYLYQSTAGAGSCAYIIDTGVFAAHPEFEGRATQIKSYTGVKTDDNGHGTHVAGTIGSATYGVAKKSKIFAVKALDGSGTGSWSDIIAGIQFVVGHYKKNTCPSGAVVNMSLGGDKSVSINAAVAAAVDAGIFFAVAAGNESVDFVGTSPADEPKAFAVGASDITDSFADFSNFGKTLGAIAPGVDVLSTWNDGGTKSISGTSMATPHIAGLAAYLGALNGAISPAAMRTKIQSLATANAILLPSFVKSGGTPNKLAFNGFK